jgi:hypothetical protein
MKKSTIDYILKNWKNKTVDMMATELGMQPNTLRAQCVKMGIEPISSKDLRVAFVLDNSHRMTVSQMAEKMDVTAHTVNSIMTEYGIEAIKEKAHVGRSEYMNPDLVEHIRNMQQKELIKDRPPAVYTQTGSPFGLSDELKGLKIK